MKKAFKIVFFLLLTVMAMYGFAKFTGANIVNSTINSTAIGATTPSTGAFTALTSSTSILFNGSVLASGTAFKHIRVTSCTTAAGSDTNFCNTTVTWPAPAFPDTSYSYGCSGDGNGAASFVNTSSASKTASSIVAVVQNTRGNPTANSVTLSCWAFHD